MESSCANTFRKTVHFAEYKRPNARVSMEVDKVFTGSKRKYAQRKLKKSDNWRRASTSILSKDSRPLEKRRNTISTPHAPRILIEQHDEEADEASQSMDMEYDESYLNPSYALDAAVAKNDHRQLEAILSSGRIMLNMLNASGGTAMHEAAFQGKIECLGVFLRFGSDVNLRDKEGWTPLHAAVCGGNAQAVAFLVSNGASLVATTDDGLRAVEIAMDAKNAKILRVLSIAETGGKNMQ